MSKNLYIENGTQKRREGEGAHKDFVASAKIERTKPLLSLIKRRGRKEKLGEKKRPSRFLNKVISAEMIYFRVLPCDIEKDCYLEKSVCAKKASEMRKAFRNT